MSYKITNKAGKCVRKVGRDGCPGCPGFQGCDEDFKKMLKKITDIRASGRGYYSWEDNYQGPYTGVKQ